MENKEFQIIPLQGRSLLVVILSSEMTNYYWKELQTELANLNIADAEVYFDFLYRNGLKNRFFKSKLKGMMLISNIGKLFPLFFYRDRMKRERLALSIGMFTRGEVGAGVIFIALGYGLGGPMLIISVLTIVFNLILTGIFVIWVEKLTRSAYNLEQAGKAKAVN